MDRPNWDSLGWWRPRPALGAAMVLLPFGWLYGLGGWLRRRLTTPVRLDIPVVCVGNVIMGGAGKTPVVMMIAESLLKRGEAVHILTRGYGGRLAGPVRVEGRHDAEEVGDEPLLLSRRAPTWVSRDRAAGGRAAAAAGASVIVMDDGFQNPGLWKDLSVVVVDDRGFGNGCVFPAGPLRESATAALSRADAVVAMGDPAAAGAPPCPVLPGRLQVRGEIPAGRFVSFAGIGWPEKFHKMLRGMGVSVVASRGFPDHHRFTEREAAGLLAEAEQQTAGLITTEKDAVRLESAPAGSARARLLEQVRVVAVDVEMFDGGALDNMLHDMLSRKKPL